MSEVPRIEIEVMFLPKTEGGRDRPPVVSAPRMYRPHLVVGGGEYLGVAFLAASSEVIEPHQLVAATVELVYHPMVDYSALVPGADFEVREGGSVVGRGRVLKT